MSPKPVSEVLETTVSKELVNGLEEIVNDLKRRQQDDNKPNLRRLKEMVEVRDDIVKLMVQTGNRIGAKRKGNKWVFIRKYSVCENNHEVLLKEDEKRDKCPICGLPVKIIEEEPPAELVEIFLQLVQTRKKIEALIGKEVLKFPEFRKFLIFIKGIGPLNGARLIAYLYPIIFGFNVNKARAYAGLAVMFTCPKCGYYYYAGKSSNGEPAIPSEQGWLCPVDGTKLVGKSAKGVRYNRKVKTFLLGILGTSLITGKGVYAKIIKDFAEEVSGKHPDWPKMRVMRTAIRKAVSLLLSQYFAVSLHIHKGVPLKEAYKTVLGKVYDQLSKHEDFIEAPITDYYADVKSDKILAEFKKVVRELGIDENEVVLWMKKKKIIE
jgi:predicted RNA-binding Zn-ribbon protein involved in translation (DUF1610 family)